MINNDLVIKFLRANPTLNHFYIEQQAGIQTDLLNKLIEGKMYLNENDLSKLEPVLHNHGFRADSSYKKAKIISVVNHKGGVGKTTTVINIGKALKLLGYRVLLIDMDSQGNLSQCYGIHEPEEQVIDSLLGREPLPLLELENNLYLSPSDIRMAYKELELVNAIGGEKRLSNKLSLLSNDFDFIIIDCPPSLNIMTTAALVASQECLVPIQPEASAYYGVENLFNRIFEIREHINYSLTVKGILYTMVHKKQSIHKGMIEHIEATYGHFNIFKTQIDNSTIIRQSQVAKQDVFTYSPKSVSSEQYLNAAKELATL